MARRAISLTTAAAYSGISRSFPAYVLKSQYRHLVRQNGTWTCAARGAIHSASIVKVSPAYQTRLRSRAMIVDVHAPVFSDQVLQRRAALAERDEWFGRL